MEHIRVNDKVRLEQINPSMAHIIFQTIDRDRDFLKQWLPFINYTWHIEDTQAFIESLGSKGNKGDLVFTIDRTGNGTVVSSPTLKGAAEQLVDTYATAYEFFPALPGGAVDPGDTWADTIQFTSNRAGGETETTSTYLYTLVGDTLVDGKTLLHITYTGENETEGTALNQGMEMMTSMSGDVEGLVLWDPARSLMVHTEGSVELDGTLEMPGSGMPAMTLAVSGAGKAYLQGG